MQVSAKVKYHPDSSIERYKARLVAQGFSQVHRVDYIKTFVPTVKCKLLRIILAITAMVKMILIQMDIIRAYLDSVLGQNKYPIFMKIPQKCLVV